MTQNLYHRILAIVSIILLLQTAAAALEVRAIRTEPTPLETGAYADAWIKVVNNQNQRVNVSSITFHEQFPFNIDPDEQTRYEIGTMWPREEYRFHFQFKVDENAVQGTNHLAFRIREANEPGYTTKRIPVEIRTDDAALVFSDIQFPDEVAPGTTAVLNLTLQNQADSHLKNIDIGIDLSGNEMPFAPADSTRNRVQSLAPGERTTVRFRITVGSEASSGLYKLPLSLQYENEAGTSFQQQDLTGITVGGDPQLATGINEISLQRAGTSGTVTLRIINRGDEAAQYVSMELQEGENYQLLSPSSVYLGTMEPDDYQTAEFRLYAEEDARNLSLPVTFSYQTAENTGKDVTHLVPIELHSQQQLRRFGLADQGGRQGLIIGIVVAALIAGYIYWRRRG